mgnify:CR=1 FL=1
MDESSIRNLRIWFGTESGNAEMAAEDLAAELGVDSGHVSDLHDLAPEDIDRAALTIILCSTYGEGELPRGGRAFAERLRSAAGEAPLSGLRYLLMGLGDRSYAETYSRGAEHLDEALQAAGARRVGEIGRHDASGWDEVGETAIAWAAEALAGITANIETAGAPA